MNNTQSKNPFITLTEIMIAAEEAAVSKEEIGEVVTEARRTNRPIRQTGRRFRAKYQLMDIMFRLMYLAVTLKARKRRGDSVAAAEVYFEQLHATMTGWDYNTSQISELIRELREITNQLEQLVKVGSHEGR